MAAKKLEWIFSMLDRMSGPAGKITKVLESVGAESKHAKSNFESFQTQLENGLKLGDRAFHLAEGIADVAFEFSKATIEAASFKETSLVALETVLGTAKQANDLFGSTVELASHLPIKTQQALGIEKSFALHGMKDPNVLNRLLIGAADVKGISGEEGVEAFTRQINDIMSVGLSARHLQFLSQGAGIGEDKIFAEIRKITGAKGNDEQIKKLVEQHAFDKNVALTAVLQALAGIQGGQLGNLSKRLSLTVEGLTSTLASRPFEFATKLQTQPAYEAFRGFLSNLVNVTGPGSFFSADLDKQVKATFGDVFGTIFGGLSGDAGAATMVQLLNKVMLGVQDIGGGLEIAAVAGKAFLGGFFDALNIGGDLFGPNGKMDPVALKQLGLEAREFGHELGSIASALGDVVGWVAKLSSYEERLKATLGPLGQLADLTSPTAVMNAPGRALSLAMEGPRGLASLGRSTIGAASQLGDMTTSIVNHITVHGDGDPKVIEQAANEGTKNAIGNGHARPPMGG